MEHSRLLDYFIWFCLSILGGVAKYLNEYLTSGKSIVFGQLAAKSIISAFSGYMFAEFMSKVNAEWTTIAAGMGGFLGVQAIEYIWTKLKKI